MDRSESKQEVEKAGNVIQLLSSAKTSELESSSTAKTSAAKIAFLPKFKHLHLGIRTQPSGAQRYVVVRRPTGSTKLVIVTLCDVARGEKHAVKLATAKNVEMDAGRNPNAERKANRAAERAARHAKAHHNFLSIGKAFIQRAKNNKDKPARRRTLDEYARILHSADLQPWHSRSVTDISEADVERLIAKVQERAPSMANRLYDIIKGTLKQAVRSKALAVNPLLNFDTKANLSREIPRERTLIDPITGDATELLAVWRGVDRIEPANHPARALVKLLILTGLRVGVLTRVVSSSVRALEWRMVKDLNTPDARLEIPPALRKTGSDGKTQYMPLVPAAVAILNDLAIVGPNAPVLTMDGELPLNLSTTLRNRYCRLADDAAGRTLERWTLHDLRRSVATGLGFLGTPHAIIDEILDHSTKAGIRGTYDKSKRLAVCREWLQKWSDYLDAAARSTAGSPASPALATEGAAA